jgi:hypothetical protein
MNPSIIHLRWDHADRLELRLKAEVNKLIRFAEKSETEDFPEGMVIQEQLCRRNDAFTPEVNLAPAKPVACNCEPLEAVIQKII